MLEFSMCPDLNSQAVGFKIEDRSNIYSVVLKACDDPFMRKPIVGGTIDRDEIMRLRDFLNKILEKE